MNDEPMRADEVEALRGKTNYPEPFAKWVEGRTKRRLGDAFGLKNFGVNLTELEPGAVSSVRHRHTVQDEFIYVLAGHPTLVVGEAEYALSPGDCMGFAANVSAEHQLVNRSDAFVAYLEVGDRTPGDEVEYPHDDLAARMDERGVWIFSRKDGSRY